jgi:hypothetical protein
MIVRMRMRMSRSQVEGGSQTVSRQ